MLKFFLVGMFFLTACANQNYYHNTKVYAEQEKAKSIVHKTQDGYEMEVKIIGEKDEPIKISIFTKYIDGVERHKAEKELFEETGYNVMGMICPEGHEVISEGYVDDVSNMFGSLVRVGRGYEYRFSCGLPKPKPKGVSAKEVYEKWQHADCGFEKRSGFDVIVCKLPENNGLFVFRLRMLRTGVELSEEKRRIFLGEIAQEMMKNVCGSKIRIVDSYEKPTIDVASKASFYEVIASKGVFEYGFRCRISPSEKTIIK